MRPHRTVLVGRERERAVLFNVLDEVRAGQPQALGVRGEAGIGKSRLLLELTDQARDAGALLLTGRAAELERDLPFALLVDALDDAVAPVLADLRPDQVAELAAVLPSVAVATGPDAPVASGERHRFAGALRASLERLAKSQPVVVVLDDVHWADRASADTLALLLHRPPRARVLLALATRTGRAPALEASLAQAARHGTGELIDLGPLSPDAAEALLPSLGSAARKRLYRESGGNPFYLQELARFSADTAPDRGGLEIAGVPRAVQVALAHEVRQLPPTARLALQGAAITGDPFEPDLAAAAAGLGDEAMLGELDLLLEADLVRPTDDPRRFRFRHPLVRRAVYEDTGGGWRLSAHARTAEALRTRGGPPGRRAHHVERSARPGDFAAIELLAAAAAETIPVAPASAASWYEAALRLLPDGAPHDPRRLALLRAHGAALILAGQAVRARDVLRRVLRMMPRDNAAGRVDVVEQLASLEGTWTGNHEGARRLLEAERGALGDTEPRLSAVLTLALAHRMSGSCEHATALALAQEAEAAADALGDEVLAADAAALAADAAHCALRSDDDEARAAVDRTIARAADRVNGLSDEQETERLHMRMWLGVARFFTGDITGAVADAERGLTLARRSRQGLLAPSFLVLRGMADEELGRLDQAGQAADETLEISLVSDNPQTGMWGALLASRVALARGKVTDAIAHGEAAWRFYGVDPGSAAGWTLADARLAGGDHSGALAVLETFGWVHPGLWTRDRVRAVDVAVRVLLAVGRIDEAGRWAERARAEAGGRRTGTFAGLLARIDGSVLLARGEVAEAATVLLAGAAAADEAGVPIWAGHCRTLAGEALAALGRIEEARAELRQAAAGFGAIGADGFRDAPLSVLRRLGERPRVVSAAPAPPRGDRLSVLTPREREVAMLVGDGHTNAQIAQRLYLSERTVEKHVSSLLGKLGLSSRTAVVWLLAREDRPADRSPRR